MVSEKHRRTSTGVQPQKEWYWTLLSRFFSYHVWISHYHLWETLACLKTNALLRVENHISLNELSKQTGKASKLDSVPRFLVFSLLIADGVPEKKIRGFWRSLLVSLWLLAWSIVVSTMVVLKFPRRTTIVNSHIETCIVAFDEITG